MAIKNRKLREQFDAGASSSGKGIFSEISIFVDGFTVPPSQELRVFMLRHGGRYENYFSRRSVTHIICSHLPDNKMRNFRAFSRGLPVVRPAWVVDSVAANKLLSWVPYQLNELENGTYKQQKLSSFFAPKCTSSPKIANTESHITPLVRSASGLLLHKDEKMKQLLLDEEEKCSKFREQSMYVGDDKFFKVEYAELKFGKMKDEHNITGAYPSSSCRNNRTLEESLDPLNFGHCNQQEENLGAHHCLEDYAKGAMESDIHQIQLSTISHPRHDDLHINTCADNHPDIVPQSLSQLDFSVLHELPEELKIGILEALPPHRAASFPGNGSGSTRKKFPCDIKDENSEKLDIFLWEGTPPSWVEKFQHSSCLLLNIIATQYSRSDMNGLLSLTLQSFSHILSTFTDLSAMESDELISSLFDLFKQYIELKVKSDIEELYVCFRILRRFATDIKFLQQVYDLILPFLQASISENYGGILNLPIAKE
ncbi:DNA repair protein REV1-like [Musa acuminata AAA Group]|uniref:DNA repair protein REV1-like n=1 Tax=Musa acuminata AAA Group TaxID=214697 RepID=UPI0031D1B7A9